MVGVWGVVWGVREGVGGVGDVGVGLEGGGFGWEVGKGFRSAVV